MGAELADSLETRDGRGRPPHEAALGDLEDQAPGRQARLLKDRADGADDVVLAELAGRQVDADPELRPLQAELPITSLTARLAPDPPADRDDVAGLLGHVDPLGGHQDGSVRWLPPDEGLDRHDL